MRIKALESLTVSHDLIEEFAAPIREKSHKFTYYKEKTTDLAERSKNSDVRMIANNPYPT